LSRTLADIHNDLSKLDEHGCVVAYNRACQTFNLHLKNVCQQLRAHFSDATIVYVNIYSIKYALIANASEYGTHIKNTELNFLLIYAPSLKITLSVIFSRWTGFKQSLATCYGYGGFPYNYYDKLRCVETGVVNGSIVTVREQGSHEIRDGMEFIILKLQIFIFGHD
jgi:hypothetical protein